MTGHRGYNLIKLNSWTIFDLELVNLFDLELGFVTKHEDKFVFNKIWKVTAYTQ